MFVLVEDAAEALVSSYVQVGDLVRIGDRRGQWIERAGARDALMRPVAVVEILAGRDRPASPVAEFRHQQV
jgi:hypothetical protein